MKLAYGIFYTNNINTASDFYEDVIGFTKVSGNKHFVSFAIGDALLGIKIIELPREVPGHQTIIIEVPNVDEIYEALKKKRVSISKDISTEEWGRNFSILDPDLNRVEFFSEIRNL